jgi:hypothetical protein
MPGRVPGIHVVLSMSSKAWMAGTSPAMTESEILALQRRKAG